MNKIEFILLIHYSYNALCIEIGNFICMAATLTHEQLVCKSM